MRARTLFGVYDADGSVIGEVRYFLGHLVGTTSCGLCDVTHGRFRRKRSFDELCSRLPVPLVLHHRDDQPDRLRPLTADNLPAVVVESSDGSLTVLLGPVELTALDGSVEDFERTLIERLGAFESQRGAGSDPASRL